MSGVAAPNVRRFEHVRTRVRHSVSRKVVKWHSRPALSGRRGQEEGESAGRDQGVSRSTALLWPRSLSRQQ